MNSTTDFNSVSIERYAQPSDGCEKITNRRQLLVKEFTDTINEQNVADGYRKLSPAFVNKKMAHLSTSDMDIFLSQCKRANNFSKFWWWSLK